MQQLFSVSRDTTTLYHIHQWTNISIRYTPLLHCLYLKKQIRNDGQIPYHFNWQSTCTDLRFTCKGLSFKLSNQRFFTPSFPQVYLLRLISRFGSNLLWWAHPSDVLAKNCNGRKDGFFSVFSITFLRTSDFLVLRGEHKKRGSPMTKAVVKQHRWPVNK